MKRIGICCLVMLLLCGCTPTPQNLSSNIENTVGTTVATTTTATTNTVATTVTTKPPVTTTATPSPKAQVTALLTDSHIADIYRVSYRSIFDRIRDNGFMKESLTGLYSGEYVRSIGALAILADLTGETEAAKNTLKFVTDTMRKKQLSYVPFTISADGNTVRTDDELDGRAHFVLGWALYMQKSRDTAYLDETYALMKREADAFCSDKYFCEDIGLMRNRRLTHTRIYKGSDYHDALDILTNSFVAAALEQMIAVADMFEKGEDAVLWHDTLDKLKKGIHDQLTRTVNGKSVYLEQRYYDGGKYTAENGVSWVCFAPFVTGYSGLDKATLQNTATYARGILFKKAQTGGYLAVESDKNGTVKNWILGKSVGWDLTAACMTEDYAHIRDLLQFLNATHTGDLYMEKMQPTNGSWKTIDAGNAEQVIWFLYGMASVRHMLGMPLKP